MGRWRQGNNAESTRELPRGPAFGRHLRARNEIDQVALKARGFTLWSAEGSDVRTQFIYALKHVARESPFAG